MNRNISTLFVDATLMFHFQIPMNDVQKMSSMENAHYQSLLTGSIFFLTSRSPFCPSSYGFILLNQPVHTPSDSASTADSLAAMAAPPGAEGLHHIV